MTCRKWNQRKPYKWSRREKDKGFVFKKLIYRNQLNIQGSKHSKSRKERTDSNEAKEEPNKESKRKTTTTTKKTHKNQKQMMHRQTHLSVS